MGTATLAGSYWRGGRYNFPVALTGGPTMGGAPFLQNSPTFSAQWPNARVMVEWAPFAPQPTYGDSSQTWAWEDITGDVLQADGRAIQISPMGRSDAVTQTQPAGCSFAVDNRSGKYSRGPQNSAYYPNVKLNVPVRVSISLSGDPHDKVVRFQGYVWSFRPGWDETGNFAIASVSAGGISRRLQQRSTPLRSPLFRSVVFSSHGKAYWPMEDEDGSTVFASGFDRGTPMRFTNMDLASYTGVPGSLALPTLSATSTYSAPVVASFPDSDSGSTTSFYLNVPAVTAADTAVIRIHMTGGSTGSTGVARWEIVILNGDSDTINVHGYAADTTVTVNANVNIGTAFVGAGPIQVVFGVHQSGGNIEWTLAYGGVLFSGSTSGTSTVAGTVGTPNQVSMLANAQNNGISIGHIVVYNNYVTSINPLPGQAWVGDGGDSTISRVIGLASEEDVPITFDDSDVPTWFPYSNYALGSYTWVGYQGEDAFVQLVRDAIDADLGILGDGLGPGLYFRNRADMENQNAKMTLSATADELMPPFQPEDDDQRVINSVTVTKTGGSSSSFTQTDGNLGTTAIGVYDDSRNALVRYDDQTQDIAGWLVHLGTVEGYRYPTLTLDMRKIPGHAVEWLGLMPGDRIDVTNIGGYVTQHPTETVKLLVQGWSESITNLSWDVTLNCSPQDVWYVSTLASDTGDTGTYVGRLDTLGSVTTGDISVGSTSVVVSTTSGAIWTTASDDYPLDLNIGGYRVTASACSGASSPQTFTIASSPVSILAGASVSLWQPAVRGI